MSDLGGSLGLWIGMSVLSFAEVLELLLLIAYALFRKLRRRLDGRIQSSSQSVRKALADVALLDLFLTVLVTNTQKGSSCSSDYTHIVNALDLEIQDLLINIQIYETEKSYSCSSYSLGPKKPSVHLFIRIF